MTEKIYLKNPYLTECNALIVNTVKKNNEVHVAFDKTVFYPDLVFGQPRDIGTISEIEVLHVYEKENEVFHVLRKMPSTKNVRMQINWTHRWDLMQQHSAQHLLSFSFNNIFNAKTIGFRIGSDSSTIDINIENLTDDMALKIEDYVNRIITSCFDFSIYLSESSSKHNLSDRKKKIEESGAQNENGLCGTHVRNTGEIGLIKILGWEQLKNGIRMDYYAGFRALKDYSEKSKNVKNISVMLNTRHPGIERKVKNCLAEKEELSETNHKLLEKNIHLTKHLLLQRAQKSANVNYIFQVFDDSDMEEYNEAVKKIVEENQGFVVLLYFKRFKAMAYIIACSKNFTIDLLNTFSALQKKFPLKYGGSSTFIKGILKTDDTKVFTDELNRLMMQNFNLIL